MRKRLSQHVNDSTLITAWKLFWLVPSIESASDLSLPVPGPSIRAGWEFKKAPAETGQAPRHLEDDLGACVKAHCAV